MCPIVFIMSISHYQSILAVQRFAVVYFTGAELPKCHFVSSLQTIFLTLPGCKFAFNMLPTLNLYQMKADDGLFLTLWRSLVICQAKFSFFSQHLFHKGFLQT